MPVHSKIPLRPPRCESGIYAASTGFEVKSTRGRLRLSNNDWTCLWIGKTFRGSNGALLCVCVLGVCVYHAEAIRWNWHEYTIWYFALYMWAFVRVSPACMHTHLNWLVGNSTIIRQWSGSATIPGPADKTLMYRALCSLCWDSIRLPNSRARLEWGGGVRALSYGPCHTGPVGRHASTLSA